MTNPGFIAAMSGETDSDRRMADVTRLYQAADGPRLIQTCHVEHRLRVARCDDIPQAIEFRPDDR
jgi:hypothetical protein